VQHAITDKQKLLNRIRRLRGQVDAVTRALEADAGCTEIMRLLTTVRGAINGAMAEVVEEHIRDHMIDPERKITPAEQDATDELLTVLRTYMR
jgi:DNA-binding FrmR family transcriptional regulator